jgi:hypothetical protein
MVSYSFNKNKSLLPSVFKNANGFNWLKFKFRDKNIEIQYQEDIFNSSLLYLRIILGMSILLSLILQISDSKSGQTSLMDIAGIRLLLHLPLTIIVIFLTFSEFFRDLWQYMIALWCFFTGMGILFIYFISIHTVSMIYYTSFHVFIMALFIAFRLRFLYALCTGICLIILYFATETILPHTVEINHLNRILMIGITLATGIIPGIGLEIIQRRDFLLRIKTNQRKVVIQNRNHELQLILNDRSSSLEKAYNSDEKSN